MAGRRLLVALSVAALTVCPAVAAGRAPAAGPAKHPPVTDDPRVNRLLARMTPAEKFRMLSGRAEPATADAEYPAGYLAGVPRLGIPAVRFADGPPGVVVRRSSTGMPATMGVAATFSAADATANGRVIGADARALGVGMVLEPFVNLDRDTSWRRGFDTFGEDPLLTGVMAANTVRGIQSRHVMAMVKHLVGYDGANNVVIGAQALHEVYLAPFAAAIRAGAAAVMCAYTVVNGTYACGNRSVLAGALRHALHFPGFVTSDWGANHATSYLTGGLDVEMPGAGGPAGPALPRYFGAAALRAALRDRTITMRDINVAVGRVLVAYDRFGWLGAGPPRQHALPTRRDDRVVRHTADDAATLLRNRNQVLPLRSAALRSLAVIGPGGGQVVATDGEGEHSGGLVRQQMSPIAALRAAVPEAHIRYAVGDDLAGRTVPAAALSHDGQPGLLRTAADGSQHVDATIDHELANRSALPPARGQTWSGTLDVPSTGSYWLDMQTLGAVTTLTLDGQPLISTGGGYHGIPRYGVVHPAGGNTPVPTPDGLANGRVRIHLVAGAHAVAVSAVPDASQRPVQVRLAWTSPAQQRRDVTRAAALAAHSDSAVVFAWADGDDDLSQPLPDGQDALIAKVAAENPNTVVVLNTAQPVAMPWRQDVPAVLEMWYPGDRGGLATADALLGRVDPGGHLPFTWPAAIDQELAHQADHPERSSNGVDPSTGEPCPPPKRNDPSCVTTYSEGVDIGYRFFAATGETPLYPFGYGLSYTRFRYRALRTAGVAGGGIRVSFAVTNTGRVAGDAVPQLYLGPPRHVPDGVQVAPVSLVGFRRVHLAAGATAQMSIDVSPQAFDYWSSSGWRALPGSRTLSLRTNATTAVLSARVTAPVSRRSSGPPVR